MVGTLAQPVAEWPEMKQTLSAGKMKVMRTIGDRVANRETIGFDYLRIVLAVSVLIWHHFFVLNGKEWAEATGETYWGALIRLILPLFFALSGFLVASSLERMGALPAFLWNRALRIAPALIVEILLSALILGPIMTEFPLSAYFTDWKFFSYFLNCIGYIHYNLPGVFLENPVSGIVNGSLWTVPYELECYIALCLAFLLGKLLFNIRFTLWVSLIILTVLQINGSESGFTVPNLGGRELLIFFLAGNLIYHYRSYLPSSPFITIGLLLISFLLVSYRPLVPFSALPIAYLAASFGCTAPTKSKLLRSGDYSYGIYLYAFPIQQTGLSLIGVENPVLFFIFSIINVSIFSALSWHCIEKHALKLKAWRPFRQA